MSATPTISNPEAAQRLSTPPPYDPPSYSSGTAPHPTNQIFEENEFGEMQPAVVQTGANVLPAHPGRVPSDTIYVENEYGEIHREQSEPELQHNRREQSSSSRCGEKTDQRSVELQSNGIYPENRFGELGRADTLVEERMHLSEKIKGTAEQILGKLTANKELHDKGISRKSPAPM